MDKLPQCPQCQSSLTYQDGRMYVCAECGHEWADAPAASSADPTTVIRDLNGNVLQDGDTVTVIKDLRVKGSSSVLKSGTKVKGIRLVDGDHNIVRIPDQFDR
jgi:protein PhnA